MKENGSYTVKQLSELAGVSVRTLHYYDEIGLLRPSSVGANHYRSYDDAALLRLQQILFYREMALDLTQIKAILDAPNFDLVSALQTHRQTLQTKIERLNTLIQTVDTTILHILGEVNMSQKKIFQGFSEEKQKAYEEEATNLWGETVKETTKLWNSYGKARQQEILDEGGAIYADLATNMDKGPESEEIQAMLVRWHDHLRYFYEPSIETLAGLGDMYHDHPDFNATFTAIHPALPAFLKQAIAHYVDVLETRWLERELGILEE
ncbi:MAG: MerR family transcriptional regulator [Anaerolineales bacterium]|nr:MerR family transcriptional regulator [Anaerolineales bacterium]